LCIFIPNDQTKCHLRARSLRLSLYRLCCRIVDLKIISITYRIPFYFTCPWTQIPFDLSGPHEVHLTCAATPTLLPISYREWSYTSLWQLIIYKRILACHWSTLYYITACPLMLIYDRITECRRKFYISAFEGTETYCLCSTIKYYISNIVVKVPLLQVTR
jgi:hypothetical protein